LNCDNRWEELLALNVLLLISFEGFFISLLDDKLFLGWRTGRIIDDSPELVVLSSSVLTLLTLMLKLLLLVSGLLIVSKLEIAISNNPKRL